MYTLNALYAEYYNPILKNKIRILYTLNAYYAQDIIT